MKNIFFYLFNNIYLFMSTVSICRMISKKEIGSYAITSTKPNQSSIRSIKCHIKFIVGINSKTQFSFISRPNHISLKLENFAQILIHELFYTFLSYLIPSTLLLCSG